MSGRSTPPAQLDRITTLMEAGVAEGAEVWTSSCPLPKNGFYVSPTIFTDATPSMRIAREEIFGPVLTTMTFRTPDEAVTKANNSRVRAVGGVWTEKGSRAMGMAAALRAGRDLGQHVQPVRPGGELRRLQGVGLRPRRRAVRDGRLSSSGRVVSPVKSKGGDPLGPPKST